MNSTTAGRHARLFKALMHPVRLQILDLLRGGEECVCHLEAHLDQRQAYVSQQLAVLRKAGLVAIRRDGPNIFYRIDRPEVLTLLDTARAMVGDERAPATRPATSCPCPRCTPTVSPAAQPMSVMLEELPRC